MPEIARSFFVLRLSGREVKPVQPLRSSILQAGMLPRLSGREVKPLQFVRMRDSHAWHQ